jgi:8-oxo-dGTP pyrophosphatase MutT (NUDIX family)
MSKKSNRIAIGVIINEENKMLMGKRNDTNKWTVPAGHIEENECPFVGMGRELKEETGLDAKDIKMIKAGFEDGLLLYLFEIKIDSEQKIDTSNDPDNECKDWTYEDPFDHIYELHIPAPKNWALKHWAYR